MIDESRPSSGPARRGRWARGYLWTLGGLSLPVLLYVVLAWIMAGRPVDESCERSLLRGCRIETGEWMLIFGAPVVGMCLLVGAGVTLVFAVDGVLRSGLLRRRR